VSYDLRFEICIYLSCRITAIASGQMAAGPGKDQWQVGPGHWQHFVVHLRYPGVPSIIEGRAGAAKVDFPPPSRKRMEKGDRAGRAYRGSLENLYTEREGVVYTTEGRLDLIRWWFFNETSRARHLGDWPWFTALYPAWTERRKGRRNARREINKKLGLRGDRCKTVSDTCGIYAWSPRLLHFHLRPGLSLIVIRGVPLFRGNAIKYDKRRNKIFRRYKFAISLVERKLLNHFFTFL